MTISSAMVLESVELGSRAGNRDEALRRLAALLSNHPATKDLDSEAIFRGLTERERLGSTGLGHGFAVPHCQLAKLDGFALAFLGLEEPIEFGSADGKPVDTLIAIVGPSTQRDRHIQILSSIAKLIHQPSQRDKLGHLHTPSDVRNLFITSIGEIGTDDPQERSLFQIYVEDLELFDDLLNLLSAQSDGSISVMESQNAGAYLFRMPLFAAFWREETGRRRRIVSAVVDRRLANSLIRQIQELTGPLAERTDLLVTVTDLSFAAGSVRF